MTPPLALLYFVLWSSGLFAKASAGLFSGQNRSTLEQMELEYEFSKDIASLLIEANLESNCDGNVIVTTKGCEDYLDYMLSQLSSWGPPVLLVSYMEHKDIGNLELWTKFLAWKKRPCSIVFVCDLLRSTDEVFTTVDGTGIVLSPERLVRLEEEIGHLKLPKFIESSDQVLYFSNFFDLMSSSSNGTSLVTTDNIQANILKQSGILLQIVLNDNLTEADEPETLMHVYGLCEYCGAFSKSHIRDLGFWQRNKTLFGQFFYIFYDFAKNSFNSTNLHIGYFNHKPHFSCFSYGIVSYSNQEQEPMLKPGEILIEETNFTLSKEKEEEVEVEVAATCEGVEWEMISQMSTSLDFTTTWINLSNPRASNLGETSNISNMIAAFEAGKIDMGVGGISVTPKRTMHVDFSSVFANDPIVFVVEKKSDLFALGIWLAFNPSIWPLLLLIICIVSLLFHIIIYQYTLEKPSDSQSRPKWALSTFLHLQYQEEKRKPLHVSMFEALEVTLQPLLGQPLSATQITHRPRRLLKFLLTVWWFSCLIITTLYNTSLITSLINPISPKEPETLEDLLDFGYMFKPAGKQGAFFELVKSVIDTFPGNDNDGEELSHDELLTAASKEDRKTVSLIKQISDRLLKEGSRPTSLVAYVVEESAVRGIKWEKKEIGFSQIKVIRERLFLTTYAWPTQRHAPFKKKIDSALERLNAAGLISHWYKHFGHRERAQRSVQFRLREKLGQINLNMQVLQGAFIFLIFGQCFAALVLGVEHLTKRYKFRFFTREEWKHWYTRFSRNTKRLYLKYVAAEHEELQLRRRKNKMRFRGAVRTVTTFRKKELDIPYMK